MEQGNWFIAKESNRLVIKRMIKKPDGKRSAQRYPRDKYSHIDNEAQLKDFVIRLNGKDPKIERIMAKLEFRHAFINEDLMERYYSYLQTQIPNEKDAKTLLGYLKRYALAFFIEKMKFSNPLHWHKNQHIWSKYLLNRDDDLQDNLRIFDVDRIPSTKVLKYTVNELNRFMKFLHNQKPDIPALHFEPLSKAAIKDHKARRQMNGIKHQSQYISKDHWQKIEKAISKKSWRYPIVLAYSYGLRRNEAMGVVLEDIKKSCLSLSKQLDVVENGKRQFKPLKSRNSRKIPHWFMSPTKTYEIVKQMSETELPHPDTLGKYFSEICEQLGLPRYTLHDLRRSFITNAVRDGINPEDLRLAVGHANSETTYQYYVMDARELDEEVFVPEAG